MIVSLRQGDFMELVKISRIVLVLFTCIGSIAFGQATTQRGLPIHRDSLSRGLTIITKVPFNGINYFITIVPADTTVINRMPVYNPEARIGGPYFWKDSLQFLLPESVLKFFREREDSLKSHLRH